MTATVDSHPRGEAAREFGQKLIDAIGPLTPEKILQDYKVEPFGPASARLTVQVSVGISIEDAAALLDEYVRLR